MFTIKALQDCLLTKRNGSHYSEVPQGRVYPVEAILSFGIETLHVRLGHKAGDWVITLAEWAVEGSEGVSVPEPPSDAVTGRLDASQRVPVYFSQKDNYRDPHRTCFSSSCAMLLKWYDPKAIATDDDYLKQVFHRGDTVDASVQLAALKSFGLECEFSQVRDLKWLRSRVQEGEVVAIGLLHNGHVSHPTPDSGHYILAYGYDSASDTFLCHDPGGLPNTVQGGFLNNTQLVENPGQSISYPAEHLLRRWCPDGPASGWAVSRIKKNV